MESAVTARLCRSKVSWKKLLFKVDASHPFQRNAKHDLWFALSVLLWMFVVVQLRSTQHILSSSPPRYQPDPRRFHIPDNIPHSGDPHPLYSRTVFWQRVGVFATSGSSGVRIITPLVQASTSHQQRAAGSEACDRLAESHAWQWRHSTANRRTRQTPWYDISTRTPLSSILFILIAAETSEMVDGSAPLFCGWALPQQ